MNGHLVFKEGRLEENTLLLKFETSQKPPKPAKNHPNQPKTTQTSQKPPKPAKNHPNQPKTTQTSQKPPKNHRKSAKNQANHPESQSTNSKNIKIHEGRFTQGVYKTKT